MRAEGLVFLCPQAVNTKEITGLSRSHVVEDFVRLLESKMADNGDTVTVTKVRMYVSQY